MDGLRTVDRSTVSSADLLEVDWLDTDGLMLELCCEPTTHQPVATQDVRVHLDAVGAVVVRLDILSASHRVRLRGDAQPTVGSPSDRGWAVHETVACSGASTAPHTGSGLLPDHRSWQTNGWELDFRSDISFGASTVPEAARLIHDHGRSGGTLVGRFPGHPSALTALRVESAATQLVWRSWHLYPCERPHVVATQTIARPTSTTATRVPGPSREECH